jgi:hypothetical protein
MVVPLLPADVLWDGRKAYAEALNLGTETAGDAGASLTTTSEWTVVCSTVTDRLDANTYY